MDMHTDMCMDMGVDMSMEMCMDMHMHMYIDTTMDMHMDMHYLRSKTEVAGLCKSNFFEKSTKRCGIVFFEAKAFQRYAVCLVWTMSQILRLFLPTPLLH